MRELSNEVRKVTEEDMLNADEHLRETAKKWACWVIDHNQDEALKKGLAISHSIAEYLNEIAIVD